jgi:hypothetical protein
VVVCGNALWARAHTRRTRAQVRTLEARYLKAQGGTQSAQAVCVFVCVRVCVRAWYCAGVYLVSV